MEGGGRGAEGDGGGGPGGGRRRWGGAAAGRGGAGKVAGGKIDSRWIKSNGCQRYALQRIPMEPYISHLHNLIHPYLLTVNIMIAYIYNSKNTK